ncbi:MAG: hypothetical protein QXH80_03110 [Candidatus Nanoarchaeia archaeon]
MAVELRYVMDRKQRSTICGNMSLLDWNELCCSRARSPWWRLHSGSG